MMTGRQVRQSRQRLLNRLTSRSAGRSQGRRKPARAAREPLTACPRTGYLTHYSQPDTEQPYSLSDRVLSFTHEAARAFHHRERRVSFVQVADFRIDAEASQQPPTADAEHEFLRQPQFGPAAI